MPAAEASLSPVELSQTERNNFPTVRQFFGLLLIYFTLQIILRVCHFATPATLKINYLSVDSRSNSTVVRCIGRRATAKPRKPRTDSYHKVFDSRKRRMRGLWQRNGRYDANLTVSDDLGRKTSRFGFSPVG